MQTSSSLCSLVYENIALTKSECTDEQAVLGNGNLSMALDNSAHFQPKLLIFFLFPHDIIIILWILIRSASPWHF